VNSRANKDDLKFLKQSRGVNERSNGDRVIFKQYKHARLIKDNKTIKMSRKIGWQLQHEFHNEQSFYLGNGKVRGITSTC
jgi:hypothetical protein